MNFPLFGLVLSGGESRRMGREKGGIRYPGSSQGQVSRCEQLLRGVCSEVFISCRKGQADAFPELHNRIYDHDEVSRGPAAGILAAHFYEPQASWLVLACDFPNIDEECVEELVRRRDERKAATYFLNPKGICEPLFSIWEPEALLLLGQRPFSARQVLESLDCCVLPSPNESMLINVNTPAELAQLCDSPL